LYQKLILCLLIFLSGCAAGETSTQQSARLVYGLTTELASLDPHLTTSEAAGVVLSQIYDTLVYRDPQTNLFVPGLATEWTVSEDGLRYTFRLREGIRFHDGTAFNANAVASNLDRIVRVDGEALASLGPYRGYEVLDSYTIAIRLQEPFAPLLNSLSRFYLSMASPLALAEHSDQRYQFYQVGTGPFRFVDYIPGQFVKLTRNADYNWPPSFYQMPDSPVQQVEFRFYNDEVARVEAIDQGDVDILDRVSPALAQAQSVNTEVQVIPTGLAGQPMQLLMNTANPPLDALAARQALLYGTNREEVVNTVFRGLSPAAWGPLTRPTPFYNRQVVGLYPYSIITAIELLEEAGYEDTDDDGLIEADGDPLRLTMLVPPGLLHGEVAAALQQQWRVMGIQLVTQVVPTTNSLNAAIEAGDYHLVLAYELGLDPYLLNDYFLPGAPQNRINFESDELTNRLEIGRQSRDFTIRATAYLELQALIMEEALVLPILDNVQLNVVGAQLDNVTYDASGRYPLLYNVNVLSP